MFVITPKKEFLSRFIGLVTRRTLLKDKVYICYHGFIKVNLNLTSALYIRMLFFHLIKFIYLFLYSRDYYRYLLAALTVYFHEY